MCTYVRVCTRSRVFVCLCVCLFVPLVGLFVCLFVCLFLFVVALAAFMASRVGT